MSGRYHHDRGEFLLTASGHAVYRNNLTDTGDHGCPVYDCVVAKELTRTIHEVATADAELPAYSARTPRYISWGRLEIVLSMPSCELNLPAFRRPRYATS